MTTQRGRGAMPMPDPQRGTPARGVRTGPVPGRRFGSQRRKQGSGPRALIFVAVLAVIVVIGVVTVAGPALNGFARSLAAGNPDLMRFGFIGDAVKSQLGVALTQPAGTDATPVPLTVDPGDTRSQVSKKLADKGLISQPLVFDYFFVTKNLQGKLQAGTFNLKKTMTPEEIATRLAGAPDPPKSKVVIPIREALRIEQITGLLASGEIHDKGVTIDAQAFQDLATKPSAALRKDYAFLSTLPQGRSLEGYLGSGTFSVEPTITAEQFIRLLLNAWESQNADAVKLATDSGKDFYKVLTLASLVEKEAVVDAERPIIAGVYTNRVAATGAPTHGLLNADPTVIYAYDTIQLRKVPLAEWPVYNFNVIPKGLSLNNVQVPADLASYQTYLNPGMPLGPICSPTRASLDAALAPDTTNKYLFFVAKNDGSHTHAFAKTFAEHQKNVAKYGGK